MLYEKNVLLVGKNLPDRNSPSNCSGRFFYDKKLKRPSFESAVTILKRPVRPMKKILSYLSMVYSPGVERMTWIHGIDKSKLLTRLPNVNFLELITNSH